jgi:hypothetical protein
VETRRSEPARASSSACGASATNRPPTITEGGGFRFEGAATSLLSLEGTARGTADAPRRGTRRAPRAHKPVSADVATEADIAARAALIGRARV